ncbi:hypothetical protein [Streptomyces cyaneofuscatus]|uniref:hypothetical protein n=1 Tax=Streptomyces cyaneofuscatus TaxID=66883 RepID=UPI00365064C5
MEPKDATSIPATCSHTHLFPGARCHLEGLPAPTAFATSPHPIDIYLRFPDGAATDVELHTTDPAGPTLKVPAYTTGAGTAIDAHTWTIRDITAKGAEVELTIGAKNAT